MVGANKSSTGGLIGESQGTELEEIHKGSVAVERDPRIAPWVVQPFKVGKRRK